MRRRYGSGSGRPRSMPVMHLGVPAESAAQIRELKRKNAELEKTIEILKAATSFFVRECDPPRR